MKLRDANILKRLKGGDQKAFRELFDTYYKPLSVYALNYCDSFEMAEDITQELFIKFWSEKIYLRLENTIAPYLFKAVKNNVLQAVKKDSKYRFTDIENRVIKSLEEDPLDVAHLTNPFLVFSVATVIFIAFCSNEYNNYFI